MEQVVKLSGLQYEPSKYLYYVKKFEDGIYLCRSEWNRGGKKKK